MISTLLQRAKTWLGTANAAGQAVHEYRYDAWGNVLQGGEVGGYAFTGREWDPETGLYYYRARYYDPKIGRFISVDPIGLAGGINPYRYAGDNPVNLSDPYGLAPAPPVSPPTAIAMAALLVEYGLHRVLADRSFSFFPLDSQDKQRHCYVNCMSTRIHGMNPGPAGAASCFKEAQDMARGGSWQESMADMQANMTGQNGAWNFLKSCAEVCANP